MQEINITQFPVVIITDVHTNLLNVYRIKQKYSTLQIVCLGDICDLYKKDKSNPDTITYFKESNIPSLKGNHDEYYGGTGAVYQDYSVNKYINEMPIGFKLIFPDGSNYLCFHNRPNDLWGFTDSLDRDKFLNTYPIDKNTKGVIIGHQHKNFVIDYENPKCSLIGVGALKFGDYGLLSEKGIEYQRF